jgi:hypothetical protein
VSDEALRDVYERIMRQRDATGRAGAVSIEDMQAVLERRGSEDDRVRTLDAIMRDTDTRADFEILRAAYQATPSRPARSMIPYAIAAGLILVIGVQSWLQIRSAPADLARGSQAGVSVVSPAAGAASGAPLQFVWHRVADGHAYSVQLTDADGNLVYSNVTGDTVLTLPDSVRLVAGKDYRWWVEANRASAAPIRSAVQSLRLTGSP